MQSHPHINLRYWFTSRIVNQCSSAYKTQHAERSFPPPSPNVQNAVNSERTVVAKRTKRAPYSPKFTCRVAQMDHLSDRTRHESHNDNTRTPIQHGTPAHPLDMPTTVAHRPLDSPQNSLAHLLRNATSQYPPPFAALNTASLIPDEWHARTNLLLLHAFRARYICTRGA